MFGFCRRLSCRSMPIGKRVRAILVALRSIRLMFATCLLLRALAEQHHRFCPKPADVSDSWRRIGGPSSFIVSIDAECRHP